MDRAGAEKFEQELRRELPRGLRGGQDRMAAADWAEVPALFADGPYDRSKIFLGYRGGHAVGIRDDRHVLTVAGSRAGKGVSLMIPNLLLYDGSVLAIDPKGELAKLTLGARERQGQRCHVLDPVGISGHKTSCFNPLAELDLEAPTIVDDAAQIAEALIIPSDREPHWGESARRLVKAIILYTLHIMREKPEERHFGTVLALLFVSDCEIKQKAARDKVSAQEALFLAMCEAEREFGGEIEREGSAFLELYKKSDKEFAAIMSTARTQLEFLGSQPLMKTLTGSDFSLKDLKAGKTTIYLCVPASMMIRYSRWLRLVISLAVTGFERYGKKPEIPVLLLLEEFNVLGRMEVIEAAAGQIAGFGVKLWTVLQDLGQIENHYEKSWETFIGNAGVLTFFGNSDARTLDYISKKLGGTGMIIERASGAGMTAIYGGAKAIQEDIRESPLLHPHEIEQLFAREKNRVLVTVAGRKPFVVQRAIYHKDALFKGLFDSA
ncbi:MAG: type IV secretory system conjugative DNA transfer family protein [Rhodomicrobium sp.]